MPIKNRHESVKAKLADRQKNFDSQSTNRENGQKFHRPGSLSGRK